MVVKKENYTLQVEPTTGTCPAGEKIGKQNMTEGKIPVLSCEGGCIRGEIARQAANILAKESGYARACHGEIMTVPHAAIASWVKSAEKTVLIDGCFLHCHGRILKNIIDEDRLIVFDALSHYNNYTDLFEIDDVPEAERLAVARDVAEWVASTV